MAPRVLVSDELSETAVQIFRDRGVEVDFQPKLGKDKEKLAEIIGNYRDAPAGLRIWAGATIETADMEALMPWLSFAYETQKASLAKAAA